MLVTRKLKEERVRLGASLPQGAALRPKIHLLSAEDVLDAHFAIADFFYLEEYGMAGIGFRDIGIFLSTVDRQYESYSGINLCKDEFEEVATLLYGIIKNHPFYDANKRTAFLCCLLQLHRLGRTITASEKVFEDLMVEIADNSIDHRSALKELRKSKTPQAEVKYLAKYLQKNSRKNAKLSGTIKFKALRQIVEANGFAFTDQDRGSIDLVKVEERRVSRFFLGDKVEKVNKVILTIAYHGEGVDVPSNTVAMVRKACGLTDQDGFDGEVLLRDAEPTFKLIKSYRRALQNLAYR